MCSKKRQSFSLAIIFFLCLKHSHICIKTRETEKITKSNVKNNNKKKHNITSTHTHMEIYSNV